jgi:hypothetical protein
VRKNLQDNHICAWNPLEIAQTFLEILQGLFFSSYTNKKIFVIRTKRKAHLSCVAWAANRFARQPRDILFPAIRVHYLLIIVPKY